MPTWLGKVKSKRKKQSEKLWEENAYRNSAIYIVQWHANFDFYVRVTLRDWASVSKGHVFFVAKNQLRRRVVGSLKKPVGLELLLVIFSIDRDAMCRQIFAFAHCQCQKNIQRCPLDGFAQCKLAKFSIRHRFSIRGRDS